ncbi:VWA domain-containing protein [Puniceicoccus vermicola]|uniref:VWA domain-containing protein n=1 Tax=Puniceicoccus vermicola TaxID=388746 RepID=A0A7X1E6P0_9BACT|nr:VWA domain-containing protein [Puniceicoccus vermicola]MBC2604311.1 VWA domain-containing protein [Puniceicoccus vermicola]
MTDSPLQAYSANQKKPKKKKLVGALFLAIAIQVALVFTTIFVVVLVPTEKEDPQFTAKKTIYLPQRKLEHKMAVAEFQQAAKSPMQMEKIQVSRMTPSQLPQLPEVPPMDFSPQPPDTVSPVGSTLFGSAGIGGMMQGLVGESSSISFLGIEDSASRVLIVVDVSASVVEAMTEANMPVTEIKNETIRLIRELNANTLFGIIQHSRQYQTFQSSLIPATANNKEAAIRWMNQEFRTSGTLRGLKYEGEDGVGAVLEAAFDMEPEVIFLLSDGSYQRTSPGGRGYQNLSWNELEDRIKDRQSQLAEEARIHTIGFAVDPEDAKGFSRLAKKNNGKYRSFD